MKFAQVQLTIPLQDDELDELIVTFPLFLTMKASGI